MFETLKPAPPDSILGLAELFRADTRPGKVNLSVGVYKDDTGATPVLPTVVEAERRLLEQCKTKSYLPIDGDPAYARCVKELVFGMGSSHAGAGRIGAAHTPGGTGGLRVGGDFLSHVLGKKRVWISRPTWANHRSVFESAGMEVKEYAYFNPATHGADPSAMCAEIAKLGPDDVVLLHVCCHNPTGADLPSEVWSELAASAARQGWVPFFDFAYQGFAEGLEQDRAPIQAFLEAGVEFFVASSFSKNFGLYNERVGAFALVAQSEAEAETAWSHVKCVIRTLYSNPPSHGGAVVSTVWNDPALRVRWDAEVADMRTRIRSMREALVRGLAGRGVERDFSYITRQRGMFSYTGLTDEQVLALRDKEAVYAVKGGRMNLAGLTSSNLDRVCDAIAAVL